MQLALCTVHACIHIILQGFIYWGEGGASDNALSHKSLNLRLLKLSQVAKCLRFCASYRRGHIPLLHPPPTTALSTMASLPNSNPIIIWQSGSATSLVYHMHCIATNCREFCTLFNSWPASFIVFTHQYCITNPGLYIFPSWPWRAGLKTRLALNRDRRL